MGSFILRRLLGIVPTLLIIVTVSFFVIRLAPGSPFSADRSVPAEVLADLEAQYGFDQPITTQYFMYLGNLLTGDLGLSTKYPPTQHQRNHRGRISAHPDARWTRADLGHHDWDSGGCARCHPPKHHN